MKNFIGSSFYLKFKNFEILSYHMGMFHDGIFLSCIMDFYDEFFTTNSLKYISYIIIKLTA